MLCVDNTDIRIGVGSVLPEAEEQLLKPAKTSTAGQYRSRLRRWLFYDTQCLLCSVVIN